MVVQVTSATAAALIVVLGLHLGSTQALLLDTNCGASGRLDVGQCYTITSPNYPGPYPGLAHCRWTVDTPENTIINLQCQEFDVGRFDYTSGCFDKFYYSPSGDIISGDSETYCDKLFNLNRNTTTNHFDVYFTSEYSNVDYDSYDYLWYYSYASGFRCVITVLRDTVPNKPEASSTVDVTRTTPADVGTVPTKPEASSTVDVTGTTPADGGTRDTVATKPEASSTVDVTGTTPADGGTRDTVATKSEASSTVDVTGTTPADVGTVPTKPEANSTVDVPGTTPADVGTVPIKPEASSTVDVTRTTPAGVGTTLPGQVNPTSDDKKTH